LTNAGFFITLAVALSLFRQLSLKVFSMPAIGSVHKAKIVLGDVSHETSPLEVYTGAITSVSIAGFLADLGDFQDATEALTIGTIRQQSWTGDLSTISNAWPTDRAAHRENKLLITYQDDVTEKPWTLTIPTIDFSKLNFIPEAGDAVYFTSPNGSAELVAWVAAFEALARTPDNDQHTVTVIRAEYVGRNT
jgi:hypothetical protein